jgi:hypothetical protein
MAELEGAIGDTLSHPERVVESLSDPQARLWTHLSLQPISPIG